MVQGGDAERFFEVLQTDYARLRELSEMPKARLWRAFLNPRMFPVILIRAASACERSHLGPLAKMISQINVFLFKVEVPSRAVIGPGLVLPHPMGIVLGSASIGANVTIFQNVTLGAKKFDGKYALKTRPILEDDVLIGSGAVVLGPVVVGRRARVAANSLLLQNVPPGLSAIGVPAQIQESPAGPNAINGN